MSIDTFKETFEEQRVRYVLEHQGGVVVVENVPARICKETGERFFAPDTVEQLQRIIWEQPSPSRIIQTPVFDFSAPG